MKQENCINWHLVFNAITDMTMILDRNHVILEVNPAVSTITGLEKKDLVGRYCYQIFHCSDHPPEGCPHEQLLSSGRDQTLEMEMEALGRSFLVTVAPIFDDDGKIGKTIHLAKDITPIKKIEQELKRKNRAQTVLISCNHAVARATDESQIIHDLCQILVMDGGYRLAWVGYALDDTKKTVKPMASCGVDDYYVENANLVWSDTVRGRGPVGTAIRTGKPVACRNIQTDPALELWREDALKRGYASLIALPLILGNTCIGSLNLYSIDPDAFDPEETRLLVELAQDLVFGIATLRTQAKLMLSETKYRKLMESSSDAIFLADTKTGRILEANRSAENLLGRPMSEIIGMHQTELHPMEDRERYHRIFQEHIKSGSVITDVFEVMQKDGTRIPVMASAATFKIRDKEIVQGVFRDISEIATAEEKLRQSQKMEAIGTLAGGIAHDFNNILSPIMGYTELAMLETAENTIVQSDLSRVMAAAAQAKELVQQILTFSRKATTEKRPVRIQIIIRETVKLLRASIPASIDLNVDIDTQCDPVMCNQTQVQQILMNLCTNAYHAMMEKGGRLDIFLKPVDPSLLLIPEFNDFPQKTYICLSISDTGVGIDPENMERIFDPYFTTKSKEEGTGLGLSVVHGIVESYGGIIKVKSKKGLGTVFRVYLPVIPGSGSIQEKVPDAAALRGEERILLVDDDANVLQVTQKILISLGYRVNAVSDSSEALKMFIRDHTGVDLVITDQTMPGLQGTDLAQKMMQIRPGIPIIMCTGYNRQISPEKAAQIGIRDFLVKPLSRNDLAVSIRQVLDK
ncbi:MAG: PAS domain S-box protein [Pseudomonadota bacterium]